MNKAHLITEKLALEEEYDKGEVPHDEFTERIEELQEQLEQPNVVK
ncbi:hypothetical protein SAMN05421781_0520 [Marinococcus luteus]|uniref:Uncharacterized protein n=1 Tax=Marinococcus luteus TaxID=1122204 RepID=A0A1H2R0R8_9BACI|nr:hypothetical protein [Marinococcus luteus]SDW12259.1 hypothetical protein SAMN05421781_0520 [Marinococcus luteus]